MTINLNNQSIINNTIGNRTHHCCKPVICIETGEVYNSATDAAEAIGVTVWAMSTHCTGKTRSCKGKHFTYVSRTSENIDALTARIRALSTEQSELERKAALWDAYEAEQNAKRKAEEEHQQALEKANAKLERRRRVLANAEARVALARQRVHEAMEEIYALDSAYEEKE